MVCDEVLQALLCGQAALLALENMRIFSNRRPEAQSQPQGTPSYYAGQLVCATVVRSDASTKRFVLWLGGDVAALLSWEDLPLSLSLTPGFKVNVAVKSVHEDHGLTHVWVRPLPVRLESLLTLPT